MSEGRVAQNLPVRGLRADLTPDDVADTLWALASPDVYLLLCNEGGLDAPAFQIWLERTRSGASCVERATQQRTRRLPRGLPVLSCRGVWVSDELGIDPSVPCPGRVVRMSPCENRA